MMMMMANVSVAYLRYVVSTSI